MSKKVVIEIIDDGMQVRENLLDYRELASAVVYLAQHAVQAMQDDHRLNATTPEDNAEMLTTYIVKYVKKMYGEDYTVAPRNREDPVVKAWREELERNVENLAELAGVSADEALEIYCDYPW